MKTKLAVLLLLVAASLSAQTTNLTALLQQGLFEEQANRNLDAAIADYQTLAAQFDKDRQLAATAIFRLGECYRLQNQTNEAAAQYQRILRDFPDQTTLATLSRQNLGAMGLAESVADEQLALVQRLQRPRQSELTGSDGLSEEDQEIQRLQTMLQNSPDLINAPDGSGQTPLENAALNGWLKAAAFLLDHGADVNARGGTALFAATGAGNRAMVEFLLAHGADVNAVNNSANQTALTVAAQHGFEAVTEVLLANKAAVNAPDAQGNTPLFIAAQFGRTNLVQMLLTAGAGVNVENHQGRTPLSFAAGHAALETIKVLLAANADPNAGSMDAPLLGAVDANSPGCAELLLQAGANPNVDGLMHCQPGSYGSRWYGEYSATLRSATPLWLAIQQDQVPMVQLLLKYKANPDAQTSEPPPVIFWALANTNILQALLAAGANSNTTNGDGRTPLSVATEKGSLAAVKLLLAAKADPNAGKLDAPLLVAIYRNDASAAELLLQAGANPNTSTMVNWRIETHSTDYEQGASVTPLFLAVTQKVPEAVKLLIHFKADPNAPGISDGSPLIFEALRQSDAGTLNALLDGGADPNKPNQDGQLPLDVANTEFAAELLRHGADVNAKDANGNTPLHYAVFNEDTNLVSLLLENKAEVNVRNKAGATPLEMATLGATGQIPSNLFQTGSPNPRSIGRPRFDMSFINATGPILISDTSAMSEMVTLLRQHGALDLLPNWDRITISRPSAHYSAAMFYQGTNDGNQFTLFDLLGVQYDLLTASPGGARRGRSAIYSPAPDDSMPVTVLLGRYDGQHNPLPFPDFGRIILRRPSADGTNWSELKINLVPALNSGDCAGDVPLRFGDVVEVPEADHVINESWPGLSTNALFTLKNCLTRHLQISVKNQTTNLTVAPQVWELKPGSSEYPLASLGATMPPAVGLLTAEPFMLWPVLENSKLLLASSDLSRVVVKRRDAATGKLREWTVDCSDQHQPPNFWLRDGDAIVVPEKP